MRDCYELHYKYHYLYYRYNVRINIIPSFIPTRHLFELGVKKMAVLPEHLAHLDEDTIIIGNNFSRGWSPAEYVEPKNPSDHVTILSNQYRITTNEQMTDNDRKELSDYVQYCLKIELPPSLKGFIENRNLKYKRPLKRMDVNNLRTTEGLKVGYMPTNDLPKGCDSIEMSVIFINDSKNSIVIKDRHNPSVVLEGKPDSNNNRIIVVKRIYLSLKQIEYKVAELSVTPNAQHPLDFYRRMMESCIAKGNSKEVLEINEEIILPNDLSGGVYVPSHDLVVAPVDTKVVHPKHDAIKNNDAPKEGFYNEIIVNDPDHEYHILYGYQFGSITEIPIIRSGIPGITYKSQTKGVPLIQHYTLEEGINLFKLKSSRRELMEEMEGQKLIERKYDIEQLKISFEEDKLMLEQENMKLKRELAQVQHVTAIKKEKSLQKNEFIEALKVVGGVLGFVSTLAVTLLSLVKLRGKEKLTPILC